MKALGKYTIAASLVVAVVGGAMWPFLDATGRSSMMVAVAIAFPVQLGTFLLVAPSVGDQNRFMIRWGLGVFVRMAVVAAVGLMLPRLPFNGSVLLLTICGLFFALLLLEPAFFRSEESTRFAQ